MSKYLASTVMISSAFLLGSCDLLPTEDDNPPANIAPTALIFSSHTSGVAPLATTFNGSGSSDSDGSIAQYSWAINGVPQSSSASVFTHTFDSEGTYNVTLQVTDNDGATNLTSAQVAVGLPDTTQNQAPVAHFTSSSTSGQAPLSVTFNSATSSDDKAITSYVWQIENSSYTTPNTSHTFTGTAGTYPVSLTVYDAEGLNNTYTSNITILDDNNPPANQAPTADAGSNITTTENSTVTFDGSGSTDPENDVLSYTWVVEGYVTINPITGVNPDFSFAGAGTHVVTLTVNDGEFTDSDTMSVTVTADSITPPVGDSPLNRIRYNGEDIYLSGFNIAWFDFAQDFNVDGINEAKLNEAIADLKSVGGNTLRWWIHIDGSTSPSFGSNGLVDGPGQYFIADLKRALDIAAANDVYIVPALWSFDMLKTNDYRVVPANDNYRILTDDTALQAYIDNALIPMVNELNSHDALVAWELFNEPENMTEQWFADDPSVNVNNTNGVDNLTLVDIQRTTAKMAAAIHQSAIDNGEIALVTTGSKSMAKYNSDVSTDPDSKGNLYRDDRLMALANNNPLAVLDFYEPHYYNNENKGGDWSPYHHHASYWEVDKPIVVGEIYVDLGIKDDITREYWSENLKPEYEEIEGDNMCQRLSEMGYAGAWPWQYNEQPDNMKACLSLVNIDYDPNDGNARPTASFTVGATSDAPVNITFNGSASADSDGSIASYEWRVDNEIVGTNQNLTHNFASANTYKIRLVVTDNLGKVSLAAVEFITLAGALPDCDLAPNGVPYCPLGYMDTDTDGWFWNNALNNGAGGSCIIINGPADQAPNSCNGIAE